MVNLQDAQPSEGGAQSEPAGAAAALSGVVTGGQDGQAGTISPTLAGALAAAANPSEPLRSWVERAKKAGAFADLTDQQIAALLAPGHLRHYQPGDVVIQFGDAGDSMYALLAEGRVRIVTPITLPPPVSEWLSGEKSLVELPAPQVVGHMNLLAASSRSATVEAVTELDAVEVQKSHLEELARHDLGVGYMLMRNIARSLQFLLRLQNEDVKNLTVAVALAARALKK
jgi:CRP-like cAMP-binding protein